MTTRDIRKLPPDLDKKISRDFNRLIKDVHAKLSTKKRSPVWTGFFASSWVAQGSAVKPRDAIEKFSPWSAIKRQATEEFLKNRTANAANKSTGYYNVNPIIKPRFPVKRAFNYRRSVFIGNRVEYSVYALEGGKLQMFIQGSLGKMISQTMTDKGKLFVGGSTTGGFGSSQGGVKYTEFSK